MDIIEERRATEYGDLALVRYQKGRLLGKGGFAQCYEVREISSEQVFAAKLIDKTALAKPRTRQKLVSEVHIHKAMHHPNVVSFERFFEDSHYAYILLELCPNRTMKELLKKRKRLHEKEVQYYMHQLIDAVKYVHSQGVIHRDLKLGNLFLGKNLELKLGDFGLAAKLGYAGERRKTICGTPNYIAPEVLNSKVSGHSFEADTWSIGVILYTLLIGRPPFESSNVKTTYKKIRENDYAIPESSCISVEAKSLISRILVSNPSQRPSLGSILKDPFMTKAGIPKKLSANSLILVPERRLSVEKLEPIKTMPNTAGGFTLRRFEGIRNGGRGGLVTPATSCKPVDLQQIADKKLHKTSSSLAGSVKMYLKANNYIMSPQRSSMQTQVFSSTMTGFKGVPVIIRQSQTNTQPDTATPSTSRGSSTKVFTIRKMPASAAITSRPLEANFAYVSHYKNYTEKYGIGYLLTNGTFGFFFNDLTNLLWLPRKNLCAYSDFHTKDKNTAMIYIEGNGSKEGVERKVKILQHFVNVYEKLKEGVEETGKEVGVKKIVKTKHGILFKLTNDVAQMIFIDKSKVIFSLKAKTLIYIDKKETKKTMKITNELMNAGDEKLMRRFKYTLNILNYLKVDKRTFVPSKPQDEDDILQVL
eukprot:TRINITY_DN170_c0_g4_i1.p1 TRINITY_DN170_c0_g4~~TRINITY_DN170_c0_g4_i1.p1  ORF type:complete len:645 (-),score=147.80 TRINITY_DN170_c0_g4_i1:65-1999(-)